MRRSDAGAAFPFLLMPALWASRNRARRRDRRDTVRAALFAAVGLGVAFAIGAAAFWLTWQLSRFYELGDYLLRLGLSWLFLTFLSFLAFSGVVSALSTFFLSDDLRLLMAAPIAPRRLFHARFVRTLAQASWMVVVFIVPVLAGVAIARCAPPAFYALAPAVVVPFAVIPVALGTGVTLALVSVFPARRARDILMLMGLLFAATLVILVRYLEPERLLRAESLPDLTDFFASLQSPVTPLLPSFWAGEALFSALQGSLDPLHLAMLWTTAGGAIVLLRAAHERWHLAGYTSAQEARKARFRRLGGLERAIRLLPLTPVRRHLLIKDAKVFLRDVTQWSQLLLLLALVLVYLYNFSVIDLDRVPYMSGVVKNVFALLNLGLAGFVMATVAVRFVFPAVSAEGQAFWIVRTAPVPLRAFLWSKFWTGLVPVLVLSEVLVVSANALLGVQPLLGGLSAAAILFLSFALVGMATGLGARYPRFAAESPAQVAGSYGGVMFMVVAVLVVLLTVVLLGWPASIYLWHQARGRAMPAPYWTAMAACVGTAGVMNVSCWWFGMRTGVRALEEMGGTGERPV